MAVLHPGDRIENLPVRIHHQPDTYLYDLLKGTTVLRVLRYVGCPACRIDIHDLQANAEEFAKRNAQVLIVLQSTEENLNDALQNEELTVKIVSDPDAQIYEKLAVRAAESIEELLGNDQEATQRRRQKANDLGYSHGVYEGNELQLPAMFVLDEQGTVLYAHYSNNLNDLPSAEETLAILDQKG